MKFENSIKIRLQFDTKRDTFGEFMTIFNVLREVDSINSMVLGLDRSNRQNSQVVGLKKGSAEIVAVVQDNWQFIITLLVATKGRPDITIREILENFDLLVDEVETCIQERTEGFPDFEREELRIIFNWFRLLSEYEKERIVRRIKNTRLALRNLRKIIF